MRYVFGGTVLAVVFFLGLLTAEANAADAGNFVPGRILVKPNNGANLDGLHADLKTKVLWRLEAVRGWQLVSLPEGLSVAAARAKYLAGGLVECAEPDYILRKHGEPNDPQFLNKSQWALHNVGQQGGVAGADVGALKAWDVRSSAETVIVAVVDTGVRYTHEDLADNMWTNPGEIPGNGIDDDGNGIVDDVYGVNTLNNSGDIRDDNGHGTHVAGIIGARGDNGKGVCGVAWRVKIMACKALDDSGAGTLSGIVKAIAYAIANGAHIINNSYGDNAALETTFFALRDAVVAARDVGIMFVASAGNDAVNNDWASQYPNYPASFRLDNVIAAACTNRYDGLSFFSSYGLNAVALGAPGEDILSTANSGDSDYVVYSGTSMSAPMVSGALALLKAQFPGESYLELYNRLLANTDPLPALKGLCRSDGRLNLFKALSSTSARPGNDDFDAAHEVVGLRFTVKGVNVGATREAGELGVGGVVGDRSVWWRWTAPRAARFAVSVGNASFVARVGVFSGDDWTGLTEIGVGASGAVVFEATAGNVYHFCVDGTGGAAGSFELSLRSPPANDDFADALEILGPGQYLAATADATAEVGEPAHAGAPRRHSVWFRWTPAETMRVCLAVSANTADDLAKRLYNPVAAVYTGAAVDALTEVASNDDEDPLFGATDSRVEFEAQAGIAHAIAVDAFNDATVGTFTVTLTPHRATVALMTTKQYAHEGGAPGLFTVTRTGSTAEPLTVRYRIWPKEEVDYDFWFGWFDYVGAEAGKDYEALSGVLTIPAGSTSAEIAVQPLDNDVCEPMRVVVLALLSSPDYSILDSRASDAVFIKDDDALRGLSALTVNPQTAYVAAPVYFSFNVNSGQAQYVWDFGTGIRRTGRSLGRVSYTFPFPGRYLVSVKAAVKPFAYSTEPTDYVADSVWVDVREPEPFAVTAFSLKMNPHAVVAVSWEYSWWFGDAGNFGQDHAAFNGEVVLGKDFTLAGAEVTVYVGGAPEDSVLERAYDSYDTDAVSESFTLGASGSARSTNGSFKLSRPKADGTARFKCMLKKISFTNALDDQGLIAVEQVVKNAPVVIPLLLVVGEKTFYAEVPALYSAKPGKFGFAKMVKKKR